MKSLKYILPLLVLSLFIFSGCSDDDDDDKGDFNTLMTYLEANNMDMDDILADWIVAADAVNLARLPEDYYIIDIRSAEVFATGHIPGAHNGSLATILDDAEPAGSEDILVVCYTGQSAGHAVVALRLMGYSAQVLKFGMSSWHSDFDNWSSKTGYGASGYDTWVYPGSINIASDMEYGYPDWESSTADGAALLEERVEAMLAGGFKGILYSDVLDDPGAYFINNYWGASDVDLYGHIEGSHRIKEDLTLAAGGMEYLNPDETIVTYCWTGQTSSMITAYLTVLGYDATSLKFGVNSMIFDDLTSHNWPGSFDYTYE